MESGKVNKSLHVYVKPEVIFWEDDPFDLLTLSGEVPDPTDPNQGIWIP